MKIITSISSLALFTFFFVSINASSTEYGTSDSLGLDNKNMKSKYISNEDGFEINFSGNPEIVEEPRSDELYGNYILASYTTETAEGAEMVSVSRYPESFVNNHIESETVKGCFEGYENGLGISIQTTDFRINNKAGKLANFSANGMYWTICVVFCKSKLYQILMVKMDAYPSDIEIAKFMGSFRTF